MMLLQVGGDLLRGWSLMAENRVTGSVPSDHATVGPSPSHSFILGACSEYVCSVTWSHKLSSCHQLKSCDSLLCGLSSGPPSSSRFSPRPHCPRKQHCFPFWAKFSWIPYQDKEVQERLPQRTWKTGEDKEVTAQNWS